MAAPENPSTAYQKGHRKRLRLRFIRGGPEALADHELLELLLTFAIPRKDTKPLAHALIGQFGTLGGVLRQSPEKMTGVEGAGSACGVLISLVRELMVRYLAEDADRTNPLSSPKEVADYLRLSAGASPRECVQLLCLNSSNRLVHRTLLAEGTVDQAPVYPREVARIAMGAEATAVILVHNHPGGQCRPSAEDLELTKHLSQVLSMLNIRLHDHLIVTAHEVYSITAGQTVDLRQTDGNMAGQRVTKQPAI